MMRRKRDVRLKISELEDQVREAEERNKKAAARSPFISRLFEEVQDFHKANHFTEMVVQTVGDQK